MKNALALVRSYRAWLALILTLAMMTIPAFGAGMSADAAPPDQGAEAGKVVIASDLKILGGSQGIAMVSYMADVELPPGLSTIVGAQADSGMIEGSLLVKPIDGDCSVESISTRNRAGEPFAISLKAMSEAGGPAKFRVTYLTKSISWNVTGHLNMSSDMTLDGQVYLSIKNESSSDYLDAEFMLFTTGGSVPSLQGTITGDVLWNQVKSAGQSIDLEAGSQLGILIATMENAQYRVYAGGAVGSSIKGYLGKQALKEQIKLDIFLETASPSSLEGLPTDKIRMVVYTRDNEDGLIPVKTVDPLSISFIEGKMQIKIDSAKEITAEVERTESKLVGSSSYEEAYRIIVRSISQYVTEVQLSEGFPGEWEMINNAGSEWVRKEANTALLTLSIPPRGTVYQMYKVRYTYSK